MPILTKKKHFHANVLCIKEAKSFNQLNHVKLKRFFHHQLHLLTSFAISKYNQRDANSKKKEASDITQ